FSYVPAGGGGGGGVEDPTHGQVVNGQGYTRVQPREAVRSTPLYQGGTQTASGSGGGSDSGSVGSAGSGSESSGASPGGYSGGGGTATGLTAVPR
ncbi:MAG: hypothetical protein ABL982_22810, partial [Vicinamibacterales bacterium]